MENNNSYNSSSKVAKIAGGVAAGTFILGSVLWHLLLWIIGLAVAAVFTYLGWTMIGHGFWRTALGIVFLLGGGSTLVSSLFQVISLLCVLVVGLISTFKNEN